MIRLTQTLLLVAGWSCSVAAQHYAVTCVHSGVNSATGARPQRPSIADMPSNPYLWAVYIQGLTAMQNEDQSHPLSYYQIAGIHGRPYTAWDGIHGPNGIDNTWTGYCTHDSILFTSWHRPYLCLFEQVLATYVQSAAATYIGKTNGNSYVNAAMNFRTPYWDWAASPSIPDVVNSPTTVIMMPSGKQATVRNPLYSYPFHPVNTNDFPPNEGPISTDTSTVRSPSANGAMGGLGTKQGMYNLLTSTTDYSMFATQQTSGSSIESWHGSVHMAIAGNDYNGGHMAQLQYSAYDPIFWLHHCNVDRIWALWQALNPSSYIPTAGMVDYYGTYTIAQNTYDYSSSPLTPFSNTSSGNPWTSDQCRYLSTCGYTYPEIKDWNQTPAQLRTSVINWINKNYKTSTKKKPRDTATSAIAKTTHWMVTVQVNKFACDKSFMVKIFLGTPPVDSKTWSTAPNLVGSMAVFVPPPQARRPSKTMITHGEYSLETLLTTAGLPSMEAAYVGPYLAKTLKWRVIKADGTVVGNGAVSGLKVSVYEQLVTPATDDNSLPIYGKKIEHPEITKGQMGGS